jgi:negative regulator of sigma E activity
MNPRLLILTILGVTAMICLTIIVCVHMILQSNEDMQQHFLINIPGKTSGS